MLFCHDGKMIPIANDTNATGPAGSWDGAPTLLPVQHEYDPLDTDDLMYRLNNDVKCAPPKRTRAHSSASPWFEADFCASLLFGVTAVGANPNSLLWPLTKAPGLCLR